MSKQWLAFDEIDDTGKTKIWDIYNSENKSYLGQVRWNGGWRQYVFVPEGECIWNPACLDQLTSFIRGQMEARKKERTPSTDYANGHTYDRT